MTLWDQKGSSLDITVLLRLKFLRSQSEFFQLLPCVRMNVRFSVLTTL